MTNAQILQKAIDTAVSRGWQNSMEYFAVDMGGTTMLMSRLRPPQYVDTPNEILFDSDFARKIWGEVVSVHYYSAPMKTAVGLPIYQFHLQQMVIADNPLEYLGANL